MHTTCSTLTMWFKLNATLVYRENVSRNLGFKKNHKASFATLIVTAVKLNFLLVLGHQNYWGVTWIKSGAKE